MNKVIIAATVGTSFYTNNKASVRDFIARASANYKNVNWASMRQLLANEYIGGNGRDFPVSASAELQTLAAIIKQKYSEGYEVDVRLIATDTPDSGFCAEVCGKVLRAIYGERLFYTIAEIQGLQMEDYDVFRNLGMNNLIRALKNINDSKAGREVAYCLSGGYKGVALIMGIAAQLYRVNSYYNFEHSEILIEVPALPIAFDWGGWKAKYHRILTPNILSEVEKKQFVEAGLLGLAGELTAFGAILAAEADRKFGTA